MTLLAEYQYARSDEDRARARRALALRAMVADGMSQREIAEQLGVSQSAVSQQLKNAPNLDGLELSELMEYAAPLLKALASERGYTRLAVFGSVARGEAGADSDIDLLVETPEGLSSFGFVRFAGLLAQVLGRPVDLVDYASLTPGLDDDIRRDAVLL
ncbi:nucleotidyltransferase domain-containing protein [Demequina aurantiaca]|uniref:nucleotidyltransferase domain-containing protein n=1 Tax=Demequina aurantiaca TaxID=676200 RepID=UPI003D3528B1